MDYRRFLRRRVTRVACSLLFLAATGCAEDETPPSATGPIPMAPTAAAPTPLIPPAPEQASASLPPEQVPPPPSVLASVATPAPATPASTATAGQMIYLASYRSTAGALEGWQLLKAKAASLTGLEPATRDVDLGAKGHFVRLFAQVPEAGRGRQVCRELKRLLPDCGVSRG